MRHSFSYIVTPKHTNPVGAKNWEKKPLITVNLRHQGKVVNYLALVDSGADFNVFHADLAEILGIDWSGLKSTIKFGGVKADKTPCVGHIAMLELGVNNHFFDTVMVVFSYDISNDGYGIIGQNGFFNYFDVLFDRCNFKVHLKKK